jgi:hypothetical protein
VRLFKATGQKNSKFNLGRKELGKGENIISNQTKKKAKLLGHMYS